MKQPIKRKIILTGELAKRYGREHSLAVNTPAEAIRALCTNFPDLYGFLLSSEQRNVGYKVTIDKDLMESTDQIPLPFSKTMRIVPVIGGAKKGGLFGIVLGVALIAASFYLPGAALVPALGAASPSFASIAFGIGTSMVLGGISSILAPQPKSAAGAAEVTNLPSYTFNGPLNTTAQGNPVPVGYGRMIVGSAVISAGISADDFTASGLA